MHWVFEANERLDGQWPMTRLANGYQIVLVSTNVKDSEHGFEGDDGVKYSSIGKQQSR